MAFDKVTEETVYTCTGHPLKSDIANILDWMLNQDFSTAYRSILGRDQCPRPESSHRGSHNSGQRGYLAGKGWWLPVPLWSAGSGSECQEVQ